ncbi:trans-sialidase, putative [Trypanosoma cruzi marinkellei]|uniref:Trans-sialidase, putative n=1 Tax=Trypanosoma cruzi marinkellei TaxID=85056 RepID=K2NIT1_TRYCR|nr:trans-sialidase, putative [Trypanosoma cruzi marinkellei]
MHSRVAAVKAPRTHNRRRVTGSSGRRREGRESEPQRSNMSRRVFTSAALLFLFLMMLCGSGGAAQADETASGEEPLPRLPFDWRDTAGGETVGSLRVPSLVEVDGGVFAVAEAQCTKGEGGFTGIASELLELSDGTLKKELSENKLKTQVLEECSSEEERCLSQTAKNGGCQRVIKVHVSRPTTVVNGSDIYMLAGNYSSEAAAASDAVQWGLLLVRGNVSGKENEDKRIYWNDTYGLPWGIFDGDKSLTGLIGGGGSGIMMQDGTLVFPVEGTKKENNKTVSLIIYSSATDGWTLPKGMSADGCSDPSVVEWKDKLMMMTACDDGRRRVYESGDKGESWTEALGTLSRVWGKKQDKDVKLVRSGFITATLGDANNNRNVMLVTLPVYPEKEGNVEKGELHLWLTDNTHIVDIGPVSEKDDDASASSLLYKSAENGDNAKKDELIALYEKKKAGGADKPSPGMVSVLLKKELERVKEVLATWKEVDERVSKLCRSPSAEQETSTANACSAVNITDGLVGFLSGNLSDNIWRDEYLGVNATVTGTATVATEPVDGVTFTGRGAGAEWPVGSQGENQLYHFANYNFTLVATVSIDGVPEGVSIPLMGAKMNDGDKNNPVLLGLSYDGGKKMAVLHSGGTTTEHSSDWELGTTHQVAIVLQSGNEGTAYVDGQLVGGAQRELGDKKDKGISHFYIGGNGDSTGSREGVSVTVRNVLLYNRPLSDAEITALNANKVSIPKPDNQKKLAVDALSPAASGPGAEGAASQSYSGGPRPSQQELKGVGGAEGGGESSAASTAATSSSNDAETVATGGEGTMQGNGSPQTPEVSVSSGGHGEEPEGTDARGEGIHAEDRGVTATALNSSLGNMSRGNNSDAGTNRGSGLLPLFLLLLGLCVFAAL